MFSIEIRKSLVVLVSELLTSVEKNSFSFFNNESGKTEMCCHKKSNSLVFFVFFKNDIIESNSVTDKLISELLSRAFCDKFK